MKCSWLFKVRPLLPTSTLRPSDVIHAMTPKASVSVHYCQHIKNQNGGGLEIRVTVWYASHKWIFN